MLRMNATKFKDDIQVVSQLSCFMGHHVAIEDEDTDLQILKLFYIFN